MKNFAKIVSAIMVVLATIVLCFTVIINQKTVTEKEFMDFKSEVRNRFDETSAKLDSIQSTVDKIQNNIDTLKTGQTVIFDQVKKNKEKSFWDFF